MRSKHVSGKRKSARQLGNIERDILNELTFGDLLYSFLLSARSTRLFYKLANERAMARYRRKLAIERLKKGGYIDVRGAHVHMTNTGHHALGRAIDTNRKLLENRTWDHKWRIAAFDIPEIYAAQRRVVRGVLKRAGFIKLQHSVWIFPHDCEEFIQLIKKESHLAPYILYGVLERIEGENRLKKLFGLA